MKNKKFLFTVCIPTFNRGKRAYDLVNSILPDLEKNCSILVLDNASDKEKKYYKKIKELAKKNKQLKYIKHQVNRLTHGNYLACFEYSESNYIMWISDEDVLENSYVKFILKQFKKNKNLGIIRGSIKTLEGATPMQAKIYDNEYWVSGEEALSNHSLTNNYMSGVIYNKKLIEKYDLLKYLQKNLELNKAYPHLYFELLICANCDIMHTSEVAIYEGEMQFVTAADGASGDFNLYQFPYAFGARLDQIIPLRNGFIDALISIGGTNEQFINLYIRLVEKYFYLISLCNNDLYIANNLEMEYLKKSTLNFACAAIVAYPTLEPYHDRVVEIIHKIYEQYQR